jgi:hypothetical protein
MNLLGSSRALGLDPKQLIGAGDRIRAVGGTDAANKQLASLIGIAVSDKMDKTQIANFIESSVALLTNINETGNVNVNSAVALMSTLTKAGGMSPEQAAKSVGNMQQAVAGSQGEANAFFQIAAARAGLGGGTLLGTKFAVRQGLFGADTEALSAQVGGSPRGQAMVSDIQKLGLSRSTFSKDMAQSILEVMDKMFPTEGPTGTQGRLGRAGMMESLFGTKTLPEAAKVLSILEKMSAGTAGKADQKFLEDLRKSPESDWREKMISSLDRTALNTQTSLAELTMARFHLGQEIAPATIASREALKLISEGVGTLVSIMTSIFGPVADTISSIRPEGALGKFAASLGTVETFSGGLPAPIPVKLPEQASATVTEIYERMVLEQKRANTFLMKMVEQLRGPVPRVSSQQTKPGTK